MPFGMHPHPTPARPMLNRTQVAVAVPAPLRTPEPGDIHHGRGISGTHTLTVYEPGGDVPLIIVEVDPRIYTDDLAARLYRYVVEQTTPQPTARPPLVRLK